MESKTQEVLTAVCELNGTAEQESQLTQAIHAIEEQADKEPYDLRIQTIAGVVMLMMSAVPMLVPFFIAEGKSLAGCAAHLDKTCGTSWLLQLSGRVATSLNDELFRYFDISAETLEGAV